MGSDLERFYARTERVGECLIWTGGIVGSKSKAGGFNVDGLSVRAHRWIYEQLIGPIPAGHEIDHVRARGCTGPLCVEIAHLEAVTGEENSRRARLDICRSGRHDLTDPANVRWDKQGRRRGCHPCHVEKQLAGYYANIEVNRAKSRDYQRVKAQRKVGE